MNCPHCETEIDEHEANRCLDAWVADAVMELSPALAPSPIYLARFHWAMKGDWYLVGENKPLGYYSTLIVAAWEVVGQLYGRNGGYFMLERFDSELGGDWRAVLGVEDIDGVAPTAPLAICRAALKAVREPA